MSISVILRALEVAFHLYVDYKTSFKLADYSSNEYILHLGKYYFNQVHWFLSALILEVNRSKKNKARWCLELKS